MYIPSLPTQPQQEKEKLLRLLQKGLISQESYDRQMTRIESQKESIMNKYTFYWLDGTREVLEGESVKDAFVNGGCSGGSLSALDFTCNGEDNSYKWINGKWVKKEESK